VSIAWGVEPQDFPTIPAPPAGAVFPILPDAPMRYPTGIHPGTARVQSQ
jgi:hypothetical protein